MAATCLQIGTIRTVNPARRQARIEVFPGQGGQFLDMEWLCALLRDGTECRCKVLDVSGQSDERLVSFASGVSRDTVARLKGAAVVVAREDKRARPDGEYEASELLGSEAYDEEGHLLGTVANVYPGGVQAAIEIERPGGTVFLLPVIEQTIARVSLEEGRIVLRTLDPYIVDDAH